MLYVVSDQILPDIKVYFCVEIHEEKCRDEAEGDRLAPVVVEGVVRVNSQLGHVQLDSRDIDAGHLHGGNRSTT